MAKLVRYQLSTGFGAQADLKNSNKVWRAPRLRSVWQSMHCVQANVYDVELFKGQVRAVRQGEVVLQIGATIVCTDQAAWDLVSNNQQTIFAACAFKATLAVLLL